MIGRNFYIVSICEHLELEHLEMKKIPLTGSSNFFTTSVISGRLLGSCFQHLQMRSHTSSVSPIWVPLGLPGLFPPTILSIAVELSSPSNETLPVKTSTATIPKAKTSVVLDSMRGGVMAFGGNFASERGSIHSGASHLHIPS